MNFKEYLEENRHSYASFAEMSGLHKGTVRNICVGKTINLESAAKIELATKGKVKCMELYYDFLA